MEIELLSVVQQNQMRDGVDAGAAWGWGGVGVLSFSGNNGTAGIQHCYRTVSMYSM